MKRFAITLVLASLLCLWGAQAQDQSQSEDWFWGKPISAIQWDGLRHVDRKELEATIRPFIGKTMTTDVWAELQAQVYALEWFDSIEPMAYPGDPEKTKVLVKFVVKEKPSITALRIVGNSGLRSTEILDVVQEKVGTIYSPAKSRLDEVAIKQLYLSKGYPEAEVSSSVSETEAGASLVFQVVEGGQVSIKEIGFSGNTTFSSQSLKGQLELKEAGFLQAGAFQAAKLETDKQKVVDYYRSRGYVDAAVVDVVRTITKDPKSGKNSLSLTFALSEGKRWTFGGVDFAGNEVFSSEKLGALFTLKIGTLLNIPRLLQDKSRLDDLYYENGYIFNSIAMTEKRDQEALSISYTVSIVERDRAHIENLSFKGNTKTKDYVLARELPLEVGDIFSKAKILEGLRNLYNLQYFSSVEPQMLPGSDENLMDLVINVEEQSTAEVQFGVTLSGLGSNSTSFPLSGLVKWNEKNFLGLGKTVGVELTLSPSDQEVTLSFLDNWLFGKRIPGGFNLAFTHKAVATAMDFYGTQFPDGVPDPYESEEEYNDSSTSASDYYKMYYDYYSVTLGANTGYSRHIPLGDFGLSGGFASTLGFMGYDETKFRPASQDIRDDANKWLWTNKIPIRVYLNALDRWYNPTAGFYASQKATWAGFIDSLEAQKYIRTDTKLEAYLSLFDIPVFEGWNLQWVLGFHSAFSAIMPQPGSAEAKVLSSDDLRIDGTFVGRGWSSLYTMDNGRTLWDNWVELRMPILKDYFWLDGFVDVDVLRTEEGLVTVTGSTAAASTSYPNFSSLSWENLVMSMGLGIRFTIIQFPFRFYFAKRFSFDGSGINWNPAGSSGMDFVISISQSLN